MLFISLSFPLAYSDKTGSQCAVSVIFPKTLQGPCQPERPDDHAESPLSRPFKGLPVWDVLRRRNCGSAMIGNVVNVPASRKAS